MQTRRCRGESEMRKQDAAKHLRDQMPSDQLLSNAVRVYGVDQRFFPANSNIEVEQSNQIADRKTKRRKKASQH